MYEFAVPMPFDYEQIDYLANINSQVKKSKIKYVYNCLPENSVEKSGYEQTRVMNEKIQTIDDLLAYVTYARKNDFHFIYIMNSLNTYSGEDFLANKPRLDYLCKKLLANGVDEVRVASPFLIEYLGKHFQNMKVRCSTSMEYTSIKQYHHLLGLYKNIVEIVPSWDMNRNIPFLSNLLRAYPDVRIELMLNEGCMSGCPFRIYHSMIKPKKGKHEINEVFYKRRCDERMYANLAETVCLSNIIYPWQICKYDGLGIHNFKLVGRNSLSFKEGTYGGIYFDYLKGVDDISTIMDKPFFEFNHYILSNPGYRHIKVADVIELLPDLEYFLQKKESCADVCGVGCRYCYEKAKKLNSIIG